MQWCFLNTKLHYFPMISLNMSTQNLTVLLLYQTDIERYSLTRRGREDGNDKNYRNGSAYLEVKSVKNGIVYF